MAFTSLLSSKERVKIGDYYLDVRRSLGGDGLPVIVLLHGIGVSGTYFLPFAEVLAMHYDVRLLDMPGYGETPRPEHALSPAELADVAAGYLGETQAIIVGQSMGCQTAAQLAMRHSALCKKLILIGPTVNKWERNLFMQGVRLLQDTFREPMKLNLIILSDYISMGLMRYLKTSKYMIEDPLDEHVRRIAAPMLIIRGEEDKIAPRRWVTYLADQAKAGTAVELAHAPHVVQFVKPKELFAVCENFLTK